MARRVAVIGAGVSGLVTVKELLAQGHHPICFERADSLGGVFRFGEDDGVIWESCRLTSSGLLTAFSDFPVSTERAGHMHASEFVRYLEEYCSEFGIKQHVRFAQEVKQIHRDAEGRWQVESSGISGELTETFDAVAICSGLHQYAYVPKFPGLESFTGEVLHAADYRRARQLEGWKVLIVGAGESGADIAAEVAEHAGEAVLSLRRGVAVVSREAFGQPRDYLTSRLMNGAAHWVFQTRNPGDNHKRTVYRWLGLPIVLVDKFLQTLYRQLWENLPMFYSTSRAEVRTRLRTRKLTLQLLKDSGGTVNEQFGTKDDRFVRALATGKLRRTAGITRFEKRNVCFEDGTEFKPDLVIFCTGFETRIPFLETDITATGRYLNTFDPEVGETLAYIGFVRPAFGAIPPLAELQARWFARLLSDQSALPSKERMRTSTEHWNEHRNHVFSAKEDRLSHLVDFTEYCDVLAEQVGCKPGEDDLAQESRAFRHRYYSGPFVAAQYRLAGPGARPELTRQTIEQLPLAHPWPDRVNLQLRWKLCRALEWMLGPDYAPKLKR